MADQIIDPNQIIIRGEGVPGPTGSIVGDQFPVSRYSLDVQTAIDAAVAAGGGTVIIDRDVSVYSRVTVPEFVSLSGVGGAVLSCGNTGAGIDVGYVGTATAHPPFHDLIISGTARATSPLTIGRAVNVSFNNIEVRSAGAGAVDVWMKETQNCMFFGCLFKSTECNYNLILDSYTLNNQFQGCRFFNAKIANVKLQDEIPNSISMPYNNLFVGGMMETIPSQTNPTLSVWFTAGARNQMIGTQTSVGGILINGTKPKEAVTLRDVQFNVNGQLACIRVDSPIGGLRVDGCWFRAGPGALRVTDADADIRWGPSNFLDSTVPFWVSSSTVTPPEVVSGATLTLNGSTWEVGGVDADSLDGVDGADLAPLSAPSFINGITVNGTAEQTNGTDRFRTLISGGAWYLQQWSGTAWVSVLSRFPDGTIFTYDSPVRVGAPVAANQAVRTASIPDPTTGWPGLPVYTTGRFRLASWTAGVQDATNQWGTINTSVLALYGTGSITIERRGDRVVLEFPATSNNDRAELVAGGAIFTANTAWPDGFKMTQSNGLVKMTTAGNVTSDVTFRSSGNVNVLMYAPAYPLAIRIAQAEWVTHDPPPSTYPSYMVRLTNPGT